MFRPSACYLAFIFPIACSTSTPSATAQDTSAPCYDACLTMVAASCANYPLSSPDDCASGCSAEHTSFPQCRTESDSFYSCVTNATVMSCALVETEGGIWMEPDTSPCQAELCARDRCFATAADTAAPTRSCPALVDAGGE